MHFAPPGEKDCSATGVVTTLGELRNDGAFGWENPQLEVRYFDSRGELIDTATDTPYDMTIEPGAVVTFRVRTPAARTKEHYTKHEVLIRTAEGLRLF